MARRILDHLDFGKVTELRNALLHLLGSDPSGPVEGQGYYNTATHRVTYYHGASAGWQALLPASTTLNQIAQATGAVNLGAQQLTNMADGSADSHAVNLGQLNAAVRGQTWKDDVRVAHSSNVNVSNPGTMVYDGVTLVQGEAVLLYGQSTASQNGPYTVGANGTVALVRAVDFDANAEVANGASIPIREGTQADSYALLTTDAPIVVGTTTLSFTILGGTNITAGAGLTKTGNVIDVVAASGSGLVVNANDVDVDPVNGLPVDRGGTGAISAAGAKTNLGFPTKLGTSIGDGVATSYVVTHSFNTRNVVVSVHDATTFEEVGVGVTKNTVNQVTVTFASAPASNAYVVVVHG